MIKSVVILVVMFIINLGMIFAIIRLTKRTNDNMRKFFLEKSSEIFPMLEQQKINDTETKIEIVEKKTSEYLVNEVDMTNYKSNTFKDEYKNLKEEMNFNKENVILDVIQSEDDDEEKFSDAIKKINDDFDFDTIYELSTISVNKQLEVLNEVFNAKQKKFLENYLNKYSDREFNVTDFFNYVKEQAKLIDENFYIKTGYHEDNFNELGDNVVTVHDDEITEGIKVVHKNKMYDYSI